MKPEELFGKDYQEFREGDPFNPGNEVVGFISRKPNEYYGALIITEVKGTQTTPQLIIGSPKMHYPFAPRADGTRNYLFPTVRNVECYEKLDGTNILAYHYDDHRGQRYLTYKTRLRPFVQNSRFGPFQDMWREVGLEWEQKIKGIMHNWNCNLSFEMYGARNPHLIVYEVPLAIALLFGVSNTGRILSPTDMGVASGTDYRTLTTLPLVRRVAVIDKDYVWRYEQSQQLLEEGLTQVDADHYLGTEGQVWYLHFPDGHCIQVKCKPETIESIHFASGAHIGKNVIMATAWNALENADELTSEVVAGLLREEFEDNEIETNMGLIVGCVNTVIQDVEFRGTVLESYRKTGLNILVDKAAVMRELSSAFGKKDMRRVYGIITTWG